MLIDTVEPWIEVILLKLNPIPNPGFRLTLDVTLNPVCVWGEGVTESYVLVRILTGVTESCDTGTTK